jgi:hypothetical protein
VAVHDRALMRDQVQKNSGRDYFCT